MQMRLSRLRKWARVGLAMLYALWAQWPGTGENELEALFFSRQWCRCSRFATCGAGRRQYAVAGQRQEYLHALCEDPDRNGLFSAYSLVCNY
jgi:hypothetical protein